MRTVDFRSAEAKQMINSYALVFDVETSTDNYHWDSSKRGVSFVADVTDISISNGEYVVTLVAHERNEAVLVEEYSRAKASFVVTENTYDFKRFYFDDEQELFLSEVFNTVPHKFVGHNLFFDVRQVFGKRSYNWTMHEWHDTRAIDGLYRHKNWHVETGNYDRPDPTQGSDLLNVFKQMGGQFEDGPEFVSFMKKQRKNFPRIDLYDMFSNAAAVSKVDWEEVPIAVLQNLAWTLGARVSKSKDNKAPFVVSPEVLALMPEVFLLTYNDYFKYNEALDLIKLTDKNTKDVVRKYKERGINLSKRNSRASVVTENFTNDELKEMFYAAILNGVVLEAFPVMRKVSDAISFATEYLEKYNSLQKIVSELGAMGYIVSKDDCEVSLAPYYRHLLDEYGAWDVYATWYVYNCQINPPDEYLIDYPKYTELLAVDTEFFQFAAQWAIEGVYVDRDLLKKKIEQCYALFYENLQKLGLDTDDWDETGKSLFVEDLIFWDGELSRENKKLTGDIFDKALADGRKPVLPYPVWDAIKDIAFDDGIQASEMVTKKRRQELQEGRPFERNMLSFSKLALEAMVQYYGEERLGIFGKLSKIRKAVDTYISYLRESEYDGKVHPIMARYAVTYRLTCNSPNLQNLHFESGSYNDMAGVLRPIDPAAHVFAEFDLRSAEVMTQAANAGDDALAESVMTDDVHSANAALFFADQWAEADRDTRAKLRKASKTALFTVSYGGGVKTVATRINNTQEYAQDLLNRIAAAFPDVAQTKENVSRLANSKGYVAILGTGRRVRIESTYKNKKYEVKGYSAWNSLNQGLVGEIVVRFMNAIYRKIFTPEYSYLWQAGFRISLMVHDSIIVQMPVGFYEEASMLVINTIAECMDDVKDRSGRLINERTTPNTRWITEFAPITDANKWGRAEGYEYPIPTDIYINRWGVHTLTEDQRKSGKVPSWINQWGYTQHALDVELGRISKVMVEPEPPKVDSTSLAKALQGLNEARMNLNSLYHIYEIDGHQVDFNNWLLLTSQKLSRGYEIDFNTVRSAIESLMLHGNEALKYIGVK